MCSACSQVAPAAQPFRSPLTTSHNSRSLGMPSGMTTLSTWMGRGSPGEGTLPYNATRSAVWAASDMGLAVGACLDAARYHLFKHCHASYVSLPAKCILMFSMTVAASCCRLPDSPALIYLSMRRDICCDNVPCCQSAALLSICAHVGAKIQELRVCACLGGATTSSRSSSNREQSSV